MHDNHHLQSTVAYQNTGETVLSRRATALLRLLRIRYQVHRKYIYIFNIMNFGEHWRQCIAAAMAKGAAAVLSRSASPGELASERTSTEASQESHPDSSL